MKTKANYSKRQLNFGYWIAGKLPRFLRYFVIMDATAKASTSEAHSRKTPDDLNWREIADFA